MSYKHFFLDTLFSCVPNLPSISSKKVILQLTRKRLQERGRTVFFNSGHLVTIFTPVLCQTPGSCVFAPGHILSHWSENIRSKVKNFTNIGDTLILFYIFVKLIHNHVIRQFYVRMKCYVFPIIITE